MKSNIHGYINIIIFFFGILIWLIILFMRVLYNHVMQCITCNIHLIQRRKYFVVFWDAPKLAHPSASSVLLLTRGVMKISYISYLQLWISKKKKKSIVNNLYRVHQKKRHPKIFLP